MTGNVLRDYLTDLFPILEIGTSAKHVVHRAVARRAAACSKPVPGGSAPKHVQQFVGEGHLRWDSLGEFLALTVSLEHLADHCGSDSARVLGEALDAATTELLLEGKTPSRRVGELDNRGSHFYLALYWARALAEQSTDAALRKQFTPVRRPSPPTRRRSSVS